MSTVATPTQATPERVGSVCIACMQTTTKSRAK